MRHVDAVILYEPPSEEQRFLPEGPYRCTDGRLSWVAIQHGPDSVVGSLNLLDLDAGSNQQISLPGRPGFAFPTDRPNEFILGVERTVVLLDTTDNSLTSVLENIDANVNNTIINDGVVYKGHLVFGCKDLGFSEKKAGLYLLRRGEKEAIELNGEQICSNGKAIVENDGGRYTLFDICSCSKQVLAWEIDFEAGRIANPKVVIDLTDEPVYPDGMILTPDQSGLIIAIYDPRKMDHGQVRLYDIATGQLLTVWRCDKSPRVTCPQLIEYRGSTHLMMTTADEGMAPELRANCSNAGCLFVAETDFDGLNDNTVYPVID